MFPCWFKSEVTTAHVFPLFSGASGDGWSLRPFALLFAGPNSPPWDVEPSAREALRGWANRWRFPPLDLATESERRSAAAAAARAAFIRSRRLEGREKGVALLQAMAKLSRRPALPVLVEKVIDFLVEVPVTSLADLRN